MKTIKCNNCGSNEFTELGNGNYVCSYCGAIVESERPINNIEVNNYSVEEDSFGDDPYLAGGQFARDYENGTLKYRLADPEYAEEYTKAVKLAKGAEWDRYNNDVLSYDKKYTSLSTKMAIATIPFLGAFLLALMTHSIIMWALAGLLLIGAMVFSIATGIRMFIVMNNDKYYTSLEAVKGLVDKGVTTKNQVSDYLDKNHSDMR